MQPIKETNPLKIVINAGITIHQKVVAPAQGDVCNFTPSCSRFSNKAISKYGVIWGSLMAADRLMRCNPWAVNHLNTYYRSIKKGKIYDPIENNFIFEKIEKKDTTLPSGGSDSHYNTIMRAGLTIDKYYGVQRLLKISKVVKDPVVINIRGVPSLLEK